jgi:hypothetical protein
MIRMIRPAHEPQPGNASADERESVGIEEKRHAAPDENRHDEQHEQIH